MFDEAMHSRIRRLKVADLADGCRQLGFAGRVAGQTLRPAVPMSRLAGTAVTVRLYVAEGPYDYAEQMAQVYELGRSVPRAVLVQRNEVAGLVSMGSTGARIAADHGYVGCVASGPIRDTEELAALGFPLFGTALRAESILVNGTPPGTSIHFEFGRPMEVAGIIIAPGDAVVGDNDGLIAVESERLEAVVAEAEKVFLLEERLCGLVRRGMTLREVLAAYPEFR